LPLIFIYKSELTIQVFGDRLVLAFKSLREPFSFWDLEDAVRGSQLRYAALLLSCFAAGVPRTMAQVPAAATPPVAAPPTIAAANPAPSNEPPSVSKAMQLYRDRKYDEAAAEYDRVIQAGFSAPAGYAGLARVELRQNKITEATEAAKRGVQLGPNLAATHIALGEVYFRQGKIEEAGEEFRKLVLANTSDAFAYYGMSEVMHVSSFHRKEKLLIDRAHELNANDPDIRRAWLATLSLTDRIKELQAALDGNTLGPAERNNSEKQLARLKEIADQPARRCRLTTSVTPTQTDLQPIMYDAKRADGYGLPVRINGTPSTLLLDTGAGGILISRRIAEKAGIHKISDSRVGGIGDAGDQPGYVGYADSIKIGDLEFHDCYVEVIEKRFSDSEDGLLGADVFSDFLVDLDFPNQKLRLSQLPEDPKQPATQAALDSEVGEPRQFHERYVAPEMKSFTSVYRFGHDLLLPTKVNDKGSVFFLIDTGSVENMITLDLARQIVKVRETDILKVKGISGEVKKVYRAEDVKLQFPGFTQKMDTMLCLDMTKISNWAGTEISGAYGFGTLHMLEMKIDYRDGLVEFKFDSNRFY
jgi:tetratricopeptide (TPR) repeat protein